MSERPCAGCGEKTHEDGLCGGDMCRACHVSLSFEDCTDGTYNVAAMRQTSGGRDDELKRIYHDAKQWRAKV